jgi:hypothetical protein
MPLQWFHAQFGLHGCHARLDWPAIRQHQTLCALPVRAKDALRRPIYGMMSEHAHAVGEKGSGDGLTPSCSQPLLAPEKANLLSLGCWQDRVLGDPMLVHVDLTVHLVGQSIL